MDDQKTESAQQPETIPQDDENRSQKDVKAAILARIEQHNNFLICKEKLKMVYVFQKCNHYYYALWRSESNMDFRRMGALRQRLQIIEKGGKR